MLAAMPTGDDHQRQTRVKTVTTSFGSYFEYPRPEFDVADIFRLYGDEYRRKHPLTWQQLRVMRDLEQCRTPALGGHVDQCDQCGVKHISYNSCRNRHCPKCQGSQRERWLETQRAALLPIEYYHVVFTLPEELNLLAQWNSRCCYTLLFRAASATLLEFGQRHLGGELGITAVLHTWGQALQLHPHVHCIVTGGALAADGRSWKSCPPGFLFPVRALSEVFRGKYCAGLQRALAAGELQLPPAGEWSDPARSRELIAALAGRDWVVYAKRPVAGPEQTLEYLSRYTHSVAISNWRIVSVADGKVSFRWKDYRDDEREKIMTLDADEFIRRFLLHVLPAGWVRIRHYGVLANGRRARRLAEWRELLAAKPAVTESEKTGMAEQVEKEDNGATCPCCGKGRMIRLFELARSGSLPLQTVSLKLAA